MNRSYRLVWSAAVGVLQDATGPGPVEGDTGSGARRSIGLRPLAAGIALVAGLAGPAAYAKTDMTITATGTTTAPCSSGTCSASGNTSVLTTGDLQIALSGGSVDVDATAGAGDGTGSIGWTDGVVDAHGNSLTLTAASSVTFDGGLTSVDNLSFGGASLHGSGFASGTGSITGLGDTAFNLAGIRAGSAGGITFSGFTSADATTVTGAATFDASTRTANGIAFGSTTSVVGTGSGATLTGAGLTYILDPAIAGAGSVNQLAFTGFGNIDDAAGTIDFGGAGRVNGNVTARALDYTGVAGAIDVNLAGAGTTGVGGTVSGVSEIDATGPLTVSGGTNDGPLALATAGVGGTMTLGALAVGSLVASSGGELLVNGSVASDAGTTLTAGSAIGEAASGAIMAGTLAGSSAGATILTGENQIADLGDFAAAGFDLVNGQSLTVSGVVDGGAAGTALTTTAGDLTVAGAVGNHAGTTTLVSAGVISEATSGAVLADTLTGSSAGATSLLGVNEVARLGNFTADGFDLSDAGPLSVTGSLVSPTVTLRDATDPIVLTGTIDTVGGAGGASGPGADGAGSVTIDGALRMLGVLDIGLYGTASGEFGSVDVTGNATFGAPGAFHFAFGSDFVGAAGDTFDFFTAASIDGFASVEHSFECEGLAPGLACGLGINAAGDGLVLELGNAAPEVPEPNALGLMSLGLSLLGGAVGWRRRRRHATA